MTDEMIEENDYARIVTDNKYPISRKPMKPKKLVRILDKIAGDHPSHHTSRYWHRLDKKQKLELMDTR